MGVGAGARYMKQGVDVSQMMPVGGGQQRPLGTLPVGQYTNGNFNGADMRFVSGWHLTIDHSDFVGADLSGANLRGFTFRDCDFTDAKMAGVDLAQADLTASMFRGADLTGANLQGIEPPDWGEWEDMDHAWPGQWSASQFDASGQPRRRFTRRNRTDPGFLGANLTGATMNRWQAGIATKSGANVWKVQIW